MTGQAMRHYLRGFVAQGSGMKIRVVEKIRVVLVCFSIIFSCTYCVSGEMREWQGKSGKSIKAEFVKLEDGHVFLKLEDGKVVQAVEEKLCDADRLYILQTSREPKDIDVKYGEGRDGYLTEKGESPEALYKDKVTFTIVGIHTDGSVKISKDSRWQYVSTDTFPGKMMPVKPGYDKALTTEGKFLLVKFSVENDSSLPVAVPPPLVIDQRDRKYLPLDNYSSEPYIPDGLLKTETDIVQPGFTKKFCTVYEVPTKSEICALEVFPVRTQPFQVRSFNVTGKRIHVQPKLSLLESEAENSNGDGDSSGGSGGDFNVFMKCTRLSQHGGSTSGYYYDYTKKRSLAYGVQLRTTSKRKETLTVKAFFIGQISNGKDAIVDKKRTEVKLEPGRIERISLQSESIRESYYYYYYGSSSRRTRSSAKLKGVIIQVWQGDKILKGYSSLSQWNKYNEAKDVVKAMGELKIYDDD
jgi:hypothetical protein